MRRIVCKNVNNMRDLGGYIARSGEVTKYYRIIRSNLPNGLLDEEISRLKQNGVTTVIDLRSDEEVTKNPNELKDIFKYYNISLIGEKYPNSENEVANQYLKMICDKNSMYKILKTIEDSDGGVLINCTTGKDRTGVVVMVLMLIADIFMDDIIADYEVSYTYIRDIVKSMHQNDGNLDPFIGHSNMEYMEDTLKLFKHKFFSIDNYMNYLGMTIEDMDKIRDKFFE